MAIALLFALNDNHNFALDTTGISNNAVQSGTTAQGFIQIRRIPSVNGTLQDINMKKLQIDSDCANPARRPTAATGFDVFFITWDLGTIIAGFYL